MKTPLVPCARALATLPAALLFAGCTVNLRGNLALNGAAVEASASAASASPPPSAPRPSAPTTKRDVHYERGRIEFDGEIHFATDKAEIREDEITKRSIAAITKFVTAPEHAQIKFRIEGHTDSRGSAPYNQLLSERRAKALRKVLIANGIAEDRVEAVGKGESEPEKAEPDACQRPGAQESECEPFWQENRRVRLVVTEGADKLEKEEKELTEPPPPPPPPPPVAKVAPPPAAPAYCRRLGFRVGAGAVSMFATAAFVWEPRCWLDLSIGLGFATLNRDADVAGGRLENSGPLLALPLRGRAWLGRNHTFIADLGVIPVFASLSGSGTFGGAGLDYSRSGFGVIPQLTLGYGYRSNGGLRVGLAGGVGYRALSLGDSSLTGGNTTTTPAQRDAVQAAGDDTTDGLSRVVPVVQLDVGYMWR